jgi:NAD(P) transhydrogenase subunit alpha
MKIGVPRERRAGETRVAATPETVKKLVAAGHEVLVESDAGTAASQPDAAYAEAGARVVSARDAFTTEMVIKVRAPLSEELATLKPGAVLVGMLNPHDAEGLQKIATTGASAFALEAAPRTTRAQSMDVLSSQANIGGYKAVLLAANLGAGVAGLQAIATAKRLGAVIEASDVRPAVREQIESLGAKFIDVPYETEEEREIAEGVGGYARPMPESWMKRQAEAVAQRVRQADVVITTALIPGRRAPVLVTEEMVRSMKPGSVIIDMAVEQGGNCPLSEVDAVVTRHGVTIAGVTNLPALVGADASALYARNVLDFLKLLFDKDGRFHVDLDDDIVKACLVCADGKVLRS